MKCRLLLESGMKACHFCTRSCILTQGHAIPPLPSHPLKTFPGRHCGAGSPPTQTMHPTKDKSAHADDPIVGETARSTVPKESLQAH